MNVYVGNRLPSTYQEVEYIQSSGTQYIDTLFTPTPKTKISIDMQFTSTATQQRLFGVGTPSTSYMTFNAYINGSTQWSRAVQNGEGTWQSTGVSADTTRHIFELDNSTYKIYTNGTQVHSSSNSTTSTTSCSHSLPLLANYYEGGVYSQASAKLYGCKLWDNGTLVRNFIPCYRKSDSVIGLYDLVNNQFYTNSGSGTFTKGSDVTMAELKNAYIGEVVYCDFTQSDYGFTFLWRDNSNDVYGRNSNGLYIDHSSYGGWGAVSWKVPNSIYSKGELSKVELTFYSTITNCGGGIADDVRDNSYIQGWRALIRAKRGGSSTSTNNSGYPANTEYKIIIDLDGGLVSTTADSTTLSLNSTQVSAAKSDWTNGNMCLNQMIGNNSTGISYIKNVTFYFS